MSDLRQRLDAAWVRLDADLAASEERLALQLVIGQQQQALDAAARRIARLQRYVRALQVRWQIARDERARAEARIAELDLALDVATHRPHTVPEVPRGAILL